MCTRTKDADGVREKTTHASAAVSNLGTVDIVIRPSPSEGDGESPA